MPGPGSGPGKLLFAAILAVVTGFYYVFFPDNVINRIQQSPRLAGRPLGQWREPMVWFCRFMGVVCWMMAFFIIRMYLNW